MGNDLATRAQNAVAGNGTGGGTQPAELPIVADIRAMENQFADAMPKGAEAVQLIRDAITCVRTTRNLADCDRYSVLGGLMTCAQLGLRVGVLGHAWLLPFWDKNYVRPDGAKGGHRAQLVIGYQGYRELAQRSGQIATLIGRAVHANDEFDIDYGLADNLVHKPKLNGDRGEITGYYTIVKYVTGGYAFWYMTRNEVEQHRDRFAMARKKQGNAYVIVGPWRDNFDEMAVKTTFLRLAKWMPKSTQLAEAIEADEKVRVDLHPDGMVHAQAPLTIDPSGSGELPPAENARSDNATTAGGAPSIDEVDEWEALDRARDAEQAAGDSSGAGEQGGA